MNCPNCQNENYVKCGKTSRGLQRYKCKNCGKSFIAERQLNNISISANTRNLLIESLLKKKSVSITDIKENCKTKNHYNTIYYWRHKILNELIKAQDKVVLSGYIQADEIYFSVNYKGNHKNSDWKMPRPARQRSADLNVRGLSKEKVGVLTALDENGVSIAIPVCTGRPTSNQVYNALKNHIKEGSTLITDSAAAYNKLAKQLKLKLIKIPSGNHATTIDGVYYHINNINNYHKRLNKFMSSFNGVSSKFLYEYVAWFAFADRKDLTDDDKKKLLNEILTTKDLKPVRKLNKLDPVNLNKPQRKKKAKS